MPASSGVLAMLLTFSFPSIVLGELGEVPSDCFERVLPAQPPRQSVVGIGVTQSGLKPGEALNEVEMSFTRGANGTVIMSLSAIHDAHFLFSDSTIKELIGLLAEVAELDARLKRQRRESYNEPLLAVPVVDIHGNPQTLVFGVSRIARWHCFSNGEWTALAGEAQTFLVLRMPFALEYAPDLRFTGLQFALSAVSRLSTILDELIDVKSDAPVIQT